MIGRLTVVGAGSVGAAVAVGAATSSVCRSIRLYDIDGPRARAEALDLRHGTPFLGAIEIDGGDDPDLLVDADAVVITAGAKQKPGQSRLDLAATNAALGARLTAEALDASPDAIVLIVSNPVDVVTQVAKEAAGERADQVIGSGTVLDTARLRVLVGERLGVSPSAVHATVIGEHGDSELVAWSSATIGGAAVVDWLADRGEPATMLDDVLDEVRGAAQAIIAGKGATSTAIGLTTARILRAVGTDERAVLPVSTAHHIDGVGTVCLSLPVVVGAAGVMEVVPIALDARERRALTDSAATIRQAYLLAVGEPPERPHPTS